MYQVLYNCTAVQRESLRESEPKKLAKVYPEQFRARAGPLRDFGENGMILCCPFTLFFEGESRRYPTGSRVSRRLRMYRGRIR